MAVSWDNIAWIFEDDGSLRDIYIQEISLNDWSKLIDSINNNYDLNFGIAGEEMSSGEINKDYVIKYLTDISGEMESMSATIFIDGININCHFFLPDQIEFDIAPTDIKSIEDYKKVESFMNSISELLGNQVTLTGENRIELPLIKIDVWKNTNKILTIEEMTLLLKKNGFW